MAGTRRRQLDDIKEAGRLVKQYGTVAAAARAAGIKDETMRYRYKRYCKTNEDGKAPTKARAASDQQTVNFSQSETGDGMEIHSLSGKVRTVAEALKKGGVDEAIWEVERFVVNSWEVGAKMPDGGMCVTPLWQVKVWLRRRAPKPITDAIEMLTQRLRAHKPEYKIVKHLKKKSDPHMLEVSVFDAHFGKLAWGKETGSDYDLKIAEKVFWHAVQDLGARAATYEIDQVLFPLGQDFFHIDSLANTTVNNTVQDVDSRLPRIFEAGIVACIKAIDHLRLIAPVKVIYVPGNHDRMTSWYLSKVLEAHYQSCKDVAVDVSPKVRKFVEYGTTLLGFTHGDEEKHQSLPLIMATECPEAWARTTQREIHLGHWHKVKQMSYVGADTVDGVIVRILPSLSSTDRWHYLKGYVCATRAAQAFLWSRALGYVGHFSSPVRLEE